jgi:hypothetical protein
MSASLNAVCEKILSMLDRNGAVSPETGLSAVAIRQTLGLPPEPFAKAFARLEQGGQVAVCLDYICFRLPPGEALAA